MGKIYIIGYLYTSASIVNVLRNLIIRFSNSGSSLYDLAAVIVHHGTGAGSGRVLHPIIQTKFLNFLSDAHLNIALGHYTAFATNNKAWFNFNDCSVKETDFQTVNSCKAYILFYVQRHF